MKKARQAAIEASRERRDSIIEKLLAGNKVENDSFDWASEIKQAKKAAEMERITRDKWVVMLRKRGMQV
jgi:hypothetical protein